MILSVVFYTFIAFTGIQIIYYFLFSSILLKKKSTESHPEKPISVIIFVKNNAKNLSQFLPSILTQKYSNFEVVLIDNNSTDKTHKVIQSFAKNHPIIRIVNVENNEAFWGSKKYALTLGIKASKYDHLLFTEATCNPISENWISEMSHQFSPNKSIILGYSSFKSENSVSNFIIRFYHFILSIQYLNFTKLGMPFMADSRNFAYKKDTFFKAKGFINHMKHEFGEDDLFMQDAANKTNTTFTISKDSFIESNTPKSFLSWFFDQRKKVFLKKKYKNKHRFFLGLFTISKMSFYLFAIIILFYFPYKIILPFIISYFLIQYIIIGLSLKKLNEKKLIYFVPFLDCSFLLIQISIFMANLISKPFHWK